MFHLHVAVDSRLAATGKIPGSSEIEGIAALSPSTADGHFMTKG
jgi:hypothetical protein